MVWGSAYLRVVLSTSHLGSVGGGENFLMRLAMALDEISDFAVLQNWPESFKDNNGFYKSFKQYNGLYQPDIFLHCSHFYIPAPIGKRNFLISFFPKAQLKPKEGVWDGCISICDYTAKYVREFWGLPSSVIYPCISPESYSVGVKSKKIISIGHFFEEPDGHSKNQHILCDAFTDKLQSAGYELVLMGNANNGDERYLKKVRQHAKGKNIRIEVNKPFDVVKSELSTASHLVSANGYGRRDPSQCEHHGITLTEALASGAIPIAHKSGGYAEIDGVIGWERPEEIELLVMENQNCMGLPEKFKVESFNKEVAKWLNSINGN